MLGLFSSFFRFAKFTGPIMREEESYIGDDHFPVWKGNSTLLQQYSRTRIFSFFFYIWFLSSVGQSIWLITGRSRVRSPEEPPHGRVAKR